MSNLNAFFPKQCFSLIRKVFVASTCDFLLIFGDCATLMGRSVLSEGFFKVCIFRSRNYGTRTFWHIVEPPYIFSISSTQNNPYIEFILHAKFEKVWIVRSWDILSERISILLKFRHFEFFYCKKYVLLDTMVHIHCFTVQKNLSWLSKDSFLWLVQNKCFI